MLRLRNLSLNHGRRRGFRSPSAVWGVAGFPGEEHPSLMIVRGRRPGCWHVYQTGAYPKDWHGSLAKRVSLVLDGQQFSTRREALQSLQAAAWVLGE